MRLPLVICSVAVFLLFVARPSSAAPQQEGLQARAAVQDLKRLSIEELAEIDVRTAGRRRQPLSETAAAVSVVLAEDIRRSGYTNLADALRLAEGLDVARVNSSTWAVSARGFNMNPANKMLVLFDGRSVYSPLTGGTFWDAQEYLLTDIDRIEVIRGPGGATWGANAVNGVINILTREASATRGTLGVVSVGSDEHATVALRHGARMGDAGSYRVYGRYRRKGPQLFAAGGTAEDPVQSGQGGFRLDSAVDGAWRWTLQGDVYRGALGYPDRPDGTTAGGNLVGRVTRRVAAGSELQFQAYYDRVYRNIPLQFREARDTWDVDVQHTRRSGRHMLVGGGGLRVTHGADTGIAGFFFDPEEKTDRLFNVFVQDEISLRRGLFLTLGTKLERNDYTGFEHQPTARIRWTAGSRTVWGAVSRAVRLPVRFDTALRLRNLETGNVVLEGNPRFEAEQVIACEAGYRAIPHPRFSLDAAVFAHDYDRLRSTDLTFRPEPVIVLGNRLNAQTRGFELASTFQAAPAWRLHGSYTWLHKQLRFDDGQPDVYGGSVEGNDPPHHVALRSYIDLPRGFAFDTILRHRAERPAPRTPRHTELNLRLGWVSPRVELSLVGQHLLERGNEEFFTLSQQFAFRRGAYLRSVWRF